MQTKYSISTYDGSFFDFLKPEDYTFDIKTIAHALSNICRYGGHSSSFYSVAEHSVLVSQMVPPELALCGLLHDASEAFVGDMPSPLKALCQDYATIEGEVHKAIAEKFSLPYPFPPAIKLADKMVYKAERVKVTSVEDKIWYVDIPKADVVINFYPPTKAKRIFLARYEELTNDKYRKAA